MSVSTTSSSQTFAGGQSVLSFNFRALTAFPQYIQVSAIALTGGTVTALSYSSQYTVTISTTGVGGTVIVTPSYGTNYNYIVYRNTAILQSSAYTDYNAFPASTLENNLDQLTMIDQEASTTKSLQLTYPIGTSTTYSTTFPIPSIGTVVGSDPTGTYFMNVPPGPTGATGPIGPSGATGNITLVSSSTSDITIVSTSTTPIITAVNAATSGSNIILRLDGSGNLPALNGSNLTNLTYFSKQNIVTGSRSLSTVYHNSGSSTMYVSASVQGGAMNTVTLGKSDATTGPTTTIAANQFYNSGSIANLDFMVMPGNYYQITASSSTVNSWIETL